MTKKFDPTRTRLDGGQKQAYTQMQELLDQAHKLSQEHHLPLAVYSLEYRERATDHDTTRVEYGIGGRTTGVAHHLNQYGNNPMEAVFDPELDTSELSVYTAAQEIAAIKTAAANWRKLQSLVDQAVYECENPEDATAGPATVLQEVMPKAIAQIGRAAIMEAASRIGHVRLAALGLEDLDDLAPAEIKAHLDGLTKAMEDLQERAYRACQACEQLENQQDVTVPTNIKDQVAEALYRAANPDGKPH